MSSRPIVTAVLGAVLLLIMALMHLILYLGFHLPIYPGVLFLLNIAAAVVVAVALLARVRVAWHLGALLAIATILAFVLARTTGLPGMMFSDWIVMVGGIPLGPITLIADVLFLVVYGALALPAGRSAQHAPATGGR